ncbi:hypothetical protein NDU88_006429 [Pleurodeles waltl]|uniref:Uncharacterized protein n=1 Tax=Pleurodeles waltl TaxID=8319 RepID=A0AAV7WEQ6_PLEWA|nr:hypothetical protein NDU88_006429 [Pleurodeles waltl]
MDATCGCPGDTSSDADSPGGTSCVGLSDPEISPTRRRMTETPAPGGLLKAWKTAGEEEQLTPPESQQEGEPTTMQDHVKFFRRQYSGPVTSEVEVP